MRNISIRYTNEWRKQSMKKRHLLATMKTNVQTQKHYKYQHMQDYGVDVHSFRWTNMCFGLLYHIVQRMIATSDIATETAWQFLF